MSSSSSISLAHRFGIMCRLFIKWGITLLKLCPPAFPLKVIGILSHSTIFYCASLHAPPKVHIIRNQVEWVYQQGMVVEVLCFEALHYTRELGNTLKDMDQLIRRPIPLVVKSTETLLEIKSSEYIFLEGCKTRIWLFTYWGVQLRNTFPVHLSFSLLPLIHFKPKLTRV